jgi:nucleoside-diphosphate-sugar epimerase
VITIGVTAVGSGIGQSVLRSLTTSSLEYRVVGMDVRSLNSGIHWVQAAYLIPPLSRREAYLERLCAIIARENVDVLIPGLDPELQVFAEHRERFEALGCTVIAPSPAVARLSGDKLAFAQWCAERGLPFVATADLATAQGSADELDYPVIVKPRAGSASAGVRLVHDAAELRAQPAGPDWIVQAYLAPLDAEGSPLAAGTRLEQVGEVSAQYLLGPDGTVLGHFLSVNRLKDGVPVEILPDPESSAIAAGRDIVEALAGIGARGPVNLQGRMTPDGVRFFELNTRFTGITGVRGLMGFREVEAAVRSFVLGQDEEARACLRFDRRFVGLRHVGDMIVPAERVAALDRAVFAPAATDATVPARLLVTGATGYAGANLAALLLEQPEVEDLQVVVRDESAARALGELLGPPPRVRPVVGDLRSATWDLRGVDTVIHAAALRPPHVAGVASDALFAVNVEGTRRLLAAARRDGVRRFVYLSTQEVYGVGRPPPWHESMLPQPETAYGCSKWMGELLGRDEQAGGMQTVVLRVGRLYGLGHHIRWQELPHKLACLTARGEPLPLTAGGRQRLDLVHVRDLCAAVVRAASVDLPPRQQLVLNVGSGRPTALRDLAGHYAVAARGLGLPEPEVHVGGQAAVTPPDHGMDIRRARAVLGWGPTVGLGQGVRELVAAAVEQVATA